MRETKPLASKKKTNSKPRTSIFLPGFRWVQTLTNPPVARSRYLKPDSEWDFFFGRSILARKWLANMTKTRQNENENFQTMAMANRDDS